MWSDQQVSAVRGRRDNAGVKETQNASTAMVDKSQSHWWTSLEPHKTPE